MSLRQFINRISFLFVISLTLGIGIFLVAVWTVDDAINYEPSLSVEYSFPPVVTATSYLVLDLESGTEIISHESTTPLPIASVTKLFSAAAFRERTNMIGTTTVTWGDVNTEGRAGKLSAGEVYPYHELVHAMLIESSNDAASSIMRTDEGVVERMNQYPENLSFQETMFADASGLSDRNQSTAYELAQLTRGLWHEQPHLFDISSRETIIGTHTGWINNNPFIGMDGYRGGKHGFTYGANRTAVAVFTETISGTPQDVLYVLLGSDDLIGDIEQLRAHIRKHVSFQ